MALPIFATSFQKAGELAPATRKLKDGTMVCTAARHPPSFRTCAVIAISGQSGDFLLQSYPVANGRVQTSVVAGSPLHCL